jgi:hypothetical protein
LIHHRLSQSVSTFRASICTVALLAGCSAEPADPPGTGGASNTAGTAGTGGSTAGTGGSTAGTGGSTAGTGGSAGSVAGGSGGTGGVPYVSPIVLNCPWEDTLKKSCSIAGCHAYARGTAVPWAGLILVPDEGLISRLKDVTGTLGDINCSPDVNLYVKCEVPPPSCSPLVGAKLVNSQSPEESLIMKKLEAVSCGDVMPVAPGDSAMTGWGPERKACIQDLVRAIAALPPQ